jgi:hypothetical protein
MDARVKPAHDEALKKAPAKPGPFFVQRQQNQRE